MSKTYNNPPNDINKPEVHVDELSTGCLGVPDTLSVVDKDGNVVWNLDGRFVAEAQALLGSTVTDAQRDSAINAVIKVARAIGGLK